jgi:polysaccharide pyruvyl transferase WcaK-like protein
MGLRLHSNICPIGLGTPSIGLANGHPKVNDLYYELDFSEQVVSVQQSGFSEQLLRSVEQTISNQGIIQDQYEEIVQTLDQDLRSFHTDIQELTKSRY